MNILKTGIRIAAGRAGMNAITFIGIIHFSRTLGAGIVGGYFLFEAALLSIAIVTNFGLLSGIEKRMSESDYRNSSTVLSTGLAMSIGTVLLFSVPILLNQGVINEYLGGALAALLIPSLALRVISRTLIRGLRGRLLIAETAPILFVERVVWLSSGIFLLTILEPVKALVGGLILSYLSTAVISVYLLDLEFGGPDLTAAKSIYTFSKFSFVSRLGGHFYEWVDLLLIGLFLTQAHVGAYEAAWRTSALAILPSRAFATTLFPHVSKLSEAGKVEEIAELLNKGTTMVAAVAIPAFFGVFVLSDQLLRNLFGPEFGTASVAFVVIMAEKILQSFNIPIGKTLEAMNHPSLTARAAAVGMVVNVTLNLVLIPEFELLGAALGTAAGLGVITILHIKYILESVHFRPNYWILGWSIICSVIMVIFLNIIAIDANTISGLLSSVVAGALLYSIFLVAPATVRHEVREIGESIR